ncbi:MAG: hypothetical protein WA908_05065 [Pontixanthobacter sp.]
MTDRKNDKPTSQEQRQAELAPETHNNEQDDHRAQAQEVSKQAQSLTEETGSPTESRKNTATDDPMGTGTKDTIDQMREMESSGKIDMDAFAGEPNHDDNVDKYGKKRKPDGLRGDGT